jgi:hypothetical protein
VAKGLRFLGLLVVGLLVMSASNATGSPSIVAIGGTPRVPANARALGAVSASTSVSGELVLKPRNNGALQRFISEVTDKSSSMFHQYLAPGAFAARFGPTSATIGAVRSQLQNDGLHVSSLSSDGLFMRFSGTASRVGNAFHTGLASYRLANGTMGRATTSAPALPSTVSGSVTAVLGLTDLVHEQPGVIHRPTSATRTFPAAKAASFPHPPGSPTACSDASQAAIANGGLTADQIGDAYGAFGLYKTRDFGAGQHIAIYELEPFARSDVKTFDTCFFGATAAASMLGRLHVVPVEGGQPAGSGSGEAILDVENISALAPGATIDVYEGPSPTANGLDYDPVDPYVKIVDNDRDQIISTSWGLCEQAIQAGQPGLQQAENYVFEQAAAQGQSVFDAAGDNGSDDCNTDETSTPVAGQNPVSVDDPTAQPYVIGVGGTTIDDATQPPLEHVWNDGALFGAGGGGISMSWTMPAWQRQAKVPGIALPGSADYSNANSVEQSFGYKPNFCQSYVPDTTSTTPCRLVPDVSADADEFTGAVTVYQAAFGGWGPSGGTSSSAPIWAAMLALVNSSATCKANATTSNGVGFASPLLYAVGSNPSADAASFNDVTAGNNDIYGLDNGLVYPATTAYDLTTGLGSPRLTGPGGTAGLAYYLCSYGAKLSRPVVSGLSPSSGSTAGGETVHITGTGFESGGVPKVVSVQVGSAVLPSSAFTVNSATSITATLPPARDTVPPTAPAPQDGAGPADVLVLLKGGEASMPNPKSIFQYVDTSATNAIPSVTGVVPVGDSESAPGPVTIMGSGFSGATRVTFGGVRATSFTVNSHYRITATPAPYASSTKCAPLPTTGVYAGENATNDICQVQVRVANANGTSATGHIRPPLEGAIAVDSLGALVAPPGCGCETLQAPTEYDYVPTPTITSVSTTGPASLASEAGTSVITIHGTGLGPLTILWADFGDPASADSMDINYVYMTGTEMQIVAAGEPVTVERAKVPMSVKTLAGQSAPIDVTYAGIPNVTGVVNTTNSTSLDGVYGGPDTGRTPIEIDGQGFSGQVVAPIEFSDVATPFSFGTQYTYTVNGDRQITTQTVAQNPAVVDVQVCTVTGCSLNPPADEFILYPPGDPTVTSVKPASGPAAGGTQVTIGGENLGCPINVFFGSAPAENFAPTPTGLDCGSTTDLQAISPPGTSGASVPVTVTTAESYFTGSGRSATSANFTYK